MYDWPEVQWANDALWAAIAERLRARGIDAPDALDRARPSEDVWLDPGLLLSQACGFPFATRLRRHVQLVGTPHHAVDGCRGPYYSSFIVVRKEDPAQWFSKFRGARAAVNARDSLSGFVAFKAALRRNGPGVTPTDWLETGSHRESLRAVADGRADIASLDAVCWALGKEYEADAVSELRILSQTALRPGLPLVTAMTHDPTVVEAIRASFADAVAADETKDACKALHVNGVSSIGVSDYEVISWLGDLEAPKPIVLPPESSDEQIFEFIRKWCDTLAAENYIGAFFMTEHRWDMTPWLIQTLIECYGWVEPLKGAPMHKVTPPAEARIRPGDKIIPDSNRWVVIRYEEPPPQAPNYIGYVHYDLPLNGFWSDVTAQFDLKRTPRGVVLELESIHVM
jgi:hypothetical protein